MKVAIIGSGNVGKALASSSVKAGHSVTIASAHPENAEKAAREVKAKAARSNKDAVKDSDLVVLAVPADKVDEVVDSLANELDGKVIIDVTNRTDAQDPGRVLDGSSVAERIQKKAPKARVVKAFNYALASRQADPHIDGTQLDAFVAGDDPEAKQKTMDYAKSIGFRPLDAGPLPMARALEGMALVNILLQIRNKWPWQHGWKLVGPPKD